jgi:L,D-transpeptidase catalytic domain
MLNPTIEGGALMRLGKIRSQPGSVPTVGTTVCRRLRRVRPTRMLIPYAPMFWRIMPAEAAPNDLVLGAIARYLKYLLFALLLLATVPTYSLAEVIININKTAQRLTVSVDGNDLYDWPVSTARWGYTTPNGTYRPEWLAKRWFSHKYDMSPMPHSIFFNGGYAIHGSYEVSHLGRPASHGCIRLSPQNATTLFALVQSRMQDTRIVITGAGPQKQRGPNRRPQKQYRSDKTAWPSMY